MTSFLCTVIELEINMQVRGAGTAELAAKTVEYTAHHFNTRCRQSVTPRKGDVLGGAYGNP